MQQHNTIQEDEIDLREVFLTLWKKRVFITIFTTIAIFIGILYSFLRVPVYEVKALVEIGSYSNNNNNNNTSSDSYIEVPQNLVTKLEIENSEVIESVNIVSGTRNILEIKVHDKNNTLATEKIEIILNGIFNRHNEEIQNYKNLIQTKINNLEQQKKLLDDKQNQFEGSLAIKFNLLSQIDDLHLQISSHNIKASKQIGAIILNEYPIYPKKYLVISIAFISGFILSIFIVFFMEFIRSFQNDQSFE